MKDVDFGKDFREPTLRKLDFEIRQGPNGLHDLVYLSSYLHDSKFTLKDVHYSSKKRLVRIRIDRDCWELYHLYDHALPAAESELKIRGVKNIRFECDEATHWFRKDRKLDQLEFEIHAVEYERYTDTFSLLDAANRQKLLFNIDDFGGAIRLIDSTEPSIGDAEKETRDFARR